MSHEQRKIVQRRNCEAGMSLLETVIALTILVAVAGGVMGLATISTSTTETQGHLAARTTEYAQDKMEQLLALKFCDGPTNGTDTTVFPAVVDAAGTGLAGCNNPGGNPPTALSGGGTDPTNPVTGYVLETMIAVAIVRPPGLGSALLSDISV